MIRKSLVTLLLFAICSLSLFADKQPSYKEVTTNREAIELQYTVDIQALVREDAINEAQGQPLRIAELHEMHLDMDSLGVWRYYDDGSRIWTFSISVPGSYGFITYFEQFSIPQGAELYVYGEEGDDGRTSVYTSEQNIYGGRYSTEVDFGHRMTFEYVAPKHVKANPKLVVDRIGYKYKPLGESFYTTDSYLRAINSAGNSCIPNINCPEGDLWQVQKKGVVKLRIPSGAYLYSCSGSLINNANQDRTPYVLTADHCFFSESGAMNDIEATEFIFDYEHPGCKNVNVEPKNQKKTIGAELLVRSPLNGGSDGGLLRMVNPIPEAWDVQYNGWSIEEGQGMHTKGAVIQHPQGDPKKIALFRKPLSTTTWVTSKEKGTPNAHWRVFYSVGVTQKGSSGSPIFNQEKLIVGSLSGGNSECSSTGGNNIGSDQYGKMSYHWDKDPVHGQQMKIYLDPNNTGITKLKGMPADDDDNTLPPIIEVEIPAMYVSRSGDHVHISTTVAMTEVKVTNLQGYVLFYRKVPEGTEYNLPIFNMNRGAHILQVKTTDGKRHKTKFLR